MRLINKEKDKMLKKTIKYLLNTIGLKITRVTNSIPRFSQEGCIENLQKNGFIPKIVIDGGGAYGDFSVMTSKYFPVSKYLIVEPLEEYKPVLERNVAHLDSKIYYNALSNLEETIEINVHEDLVGTSLMNETEAGNDGSKRKIKTILLNDLMENDTPTLIKLDLQGAEIIALHGGIEKLKSSKQVIVMCESSLFQFYQQENIKIYDLIKFFEEIDYEIYDVYGPSYRPFDTALAQIDVVFCHKESDLKKINIYADSMQRKQHNEKYKNKHNEMGLH